ncbi:hypothetical protein NDU88_005187 [Pleurodeles waltl]|uniref:Uncharacterized protein n=1 Tax=Pleurodeles waltl TaxID=8319 RepID=A0AAV7TTC0_PLEWA|nr:hypothetical protein NDU88_005187 [Pleurodeles waltl]
MSAGRRRDAPVRRPATLQNGEKQTSNRPNYHLMGKKRICHDEGERSQRAMSDPTPEEDPSKLDIKVILLEVKISLKTINGKLDLLTAGLDQVKQCLDSHESRNLRHYY